MKTNLNYKSRFRILKGGKIALVVSALLGSVTLSFASPSGGTVTSGTANITQSGATTNITQSSNKASINWQSFSIANHETVNFNQPNVNSITLNRVIGNEKSIINGALNANGQVWLLNSNGVLFGKNASINTAGLLATTSNLSDEDFIQGNYTFTNNSSASVINQGTIEVSNGAYVILASNEVKNSGNIKAVKGKVHLIGADKYSLNLNGNSLVNLTINKGVLDAMVENSGTILANGGEVYLTTNAVNELLRGVVNNTGTIEANSLDGVTGKIELFAHGGEAQIGGTLQADDGFIETSGKDFTLLDNATIHAGKWLIDPTNITIDAALASTIAGQLASGDMEVTTSTGGTDDGDITVDSDITWATTSILTLTADNAIYVNATIQNTNNTNGGVYFNAANTTDKVIFGANGKVILNNAYQLQWIDQALHGNYELGSDIDASVTSSWHSGYGFYPIGDGGNLAYFAGVFDGKNHTIDGLTINGPLSDNRGLFEITTAGSVIKNVGLTNVNIIANNKAGGLVGYNRGTITNSYVTGSVSGASGQVGGLLGYNSSTGIITNSYSTASVSGTGRVGGLVGDNQGTITNSYATGSVSGTGRVGGLVGDNQGTITNSYATGSVSGNDYVGGLVGYNDSSSSTITNSYATGSVSGNNYVGGLLGYNNGGTITNSFWDTQTSGQTTSEGGVGKTTAQMQNIATFADAGWEIQQDDTLSIGTPVLSMTGSSPVWLIGTKPLPIPEPTPPNSNVDTIITPIANNNVLNIHTPKLKTPNLPQLSIAELGSIKLPEGLKQEVYETQKEKNKGLN